MGAYHRHDRQSLQDAQTNFQVRQENKQFSLSVNYLSLDNYILEKSMDEVKVNRNIHFSPHHYYC